MISTREEVKIKYSTKNIQSAKSYWNFIFSPLYVFDKKLLLHYSFNNI